MKIIQCILFILLSVTGLQAQTRTIKGTILDGEFNNEPLPGATISVPASGGKAMTGTTSDLEGNFTLKVEADVAYLEVRFVGYQTQKVTLKPNVNQYKVIMKSSSKEMDELVVTGRLMVVVEVWRPTDGSPGCLHRSLPPGGRLVCVLQ